MEFEVGDKAVVPTLGVGVVKEIETLDLGGDTYEFYVIKILDNGSTYKCPVGALEENGIRVVMSTESIDQVIEVLMDRDTPVDRQTWNRRYREYQRKVKTNDPCEIASVLRDLSMLRAEKTLSFGERKMYDQVHGLVIQEIAVARDADEAAVDEELAALITKANDKAIKAGKIKKKKKKKKKKSSSD